MKIKQYLLFVYWGYYPSGGWHDFKGSFDTPEEALEARSREGGEYYQIVDTASSEVTGND